MTNRFLFIINLILSLLTCDAQTAHENDSTFFSLKGVPCSTKLSASYPSYSYADLRNKGVPISTEDVGRYLNPIRNTIELNGVTHSFENKYRAMEVIKLENGTFLLYTVNSRDDKKCMLADITEKNEYPVTLEIYHDIALFTYIWYTYSNETNIIQINYIEDINYCDISNGLQTYIQTVDEYMLAPGFPYIGRKTKYSFELPVNTIPTGSCPNLPPTNHRTINESDSIIYVLTPEELESISID